MKYETFPIDFDAESVVELRDILQCVIDKPGRPLRVQRDIQRLYSELEARIQHFPAGIEKSATDDWLGE